MPLDVFLYDAFSDAPFGGNVAGVVPNAGGLADAELQAVARELGAPTTGFVCGRAGDVFDLRFFTPQCEIDLCGHVTVGVFTALADQQTIDVAIGETTRAYQRTRAGLLAVDVSRDDRGHVIAMAQRAPVIEELPTFRADVDRALGVASDHAVPVGLSSTGLRHVMVPLPRCADLARIRPDFRAVAAICQSVRADTMCVFSLESRASSGDELTACMRDLCSAIGTDEEPASGTTSGALAAYLAHTGRLRAKPDGAAHLRVRQGVEYGRPSRIDVTLAFNASTTNVHVSAVTVRGRARRSVVGTLLTCPS